MGIPKLEFNLVDDLKALHQVVTRNYHSEIELFQEYLSIGKRLFNLETGIVSKIENDTYTVLAFSSPLEGLEINQVFELKDTYCREVYEVEKTVAFPHVGAIKRMCDHPVYVNMKLESYISSPIYVNGKIFGTINFTDRAIRHEGFSLHQFELIEIMAKTVGRFIEAKLAKDELQSVNEKMSMLVGVVAHDLKNPLGNIYSLSELIEEETNEEDTRKYIELIKKSSHSSLNMVKNILDMSAINCGKIKISKSNNSIQKLINESWETIDYVANKKSIVHKVDGEDIEVMFDFERMKQSVCNLFNNAIKFSKKGSQITTSWSISNSMLALKIQDKGVGMSQEQLDFVFDPTKTTSTAGTEGEIGTGYGLPLVAKIISYHNGDIRTESKKNEGTTFIISIPLV